MPGSGTNGWQSAARHHLRTYLITLTADAYTAMHYDVTQ
jgi:hypothetical protein